MMGFFTELFDLAQQEKIPDIVIAEVRQSQARPVTN